MGIKGLKLRLCKECKKKRFCKRERIPGHNFRYTCSKGHIWVLKGVTAERVVSVMEEILTPEKLSSLFNRDNAFYKELKR